MKRAEGLRFRDYLKGLPPDVIFDRLVEERGGRRRIVSTALIDEICRRFTTPSHLADRVERLSEEGRRACATAYLLGAGGLVAHGLDAVYRELIESFLVFAAHDDNEARHLVGFDDLAEPLRPILAPILAQPHPGIPPIKADTAPFRAVNDFVVVAVAALNGCLRKNRNGSLSKGGVVALNRTLSIEGGRKQSRSLCGATEVTSLLLAYGIERGIITECETGYHSSHWRIGAWVKRSASELQRDLDEFVVSWTGGWRLSYLEAMQSTVGEAWLSTEGLVPTCRQPAAAALRYLDYVRIVDAAGVGDNVIWHLRAADGGEQEAADAVTVMPDFSVILAREVAPAELYAFSTLGSISSFDQIYRGTVEQGCVNHALSRGVGPAELVDTLRRWRAPENVVATVEEWIHGYGRLSVRGGDFIVSYDQKVTRQLAAFEPIRALAEPLGADAVFVIREGMRDKVWQLLEEMGFDPRPFGRAEESDAGRSTSPAKELLEPLFELDVPKGDDGAQIRSGKYSSELKVLDINEMLHVIDFAILMGYELRFEYAGSPHVRRGRYSVVPTGVEKGNNLFLEGIQAETKRKKKFFVRKIEKIGVLTE